MNAAKFACAPECGCTLACSAPNSCFSAVDGELLDLVHDLAAAVVALAGIALGVLVGERRAHRLDHRAAGEVLARDQLEAVLLAPQLAVDEARDLGIGVAQRRVVIADSSLLLVDLGHSARVPAAGERRSPATSCRISTPSSSLTNRAGSTSTLASLCSRASRAISGVQATAARTPGCRFAA